jgi:hypothetical protein
LPPQFTGTDDGPDPDVEVLLLLPHADKAKAPTTSKLSTAVHRATFTELLSAGCPQLTANRAELNKR